MTLVKVLSCTQLACECDVRACTLLKIKIKIKNKKGKINSNFKIKSINR